MGKSMNITLIAIGSFIAGILLAPKSGRDTRRDLMNTARGYKRKASQGLDQVKQGASEVKEDVVEGMQMVKEDIKQTANNTKKAIR